MGKAVFRIRISHESWSISGEQIKVYLSIHALVSLMMVPDPVPGEEKNSSQKNQKLLFLKKKNSYLREVPLAVLSKKVVGQEESTQGEEEQKAVVEEPEKENQFFSKPIRIPVLGNACNSFLAFSSLGYQTSL